MDNDLQNKNRGKYLGPEELTFHYSIQIAVIFLNYFSVPFLNLQVSLLNKKESLPNLKNPKA